MESSHEEGLSKRFRQIMDLAYKHEHLTAAMLEKELPGAPSNSTVRTQLRVLESRGLLTRFELNGNYAYRPSKTKPNAAMAAMKRFLSTFVDGSTERALVTLLNASETDLTSEELDRLEAVLEAARRTKEDRL